MDSRRILVNMSAASIQVVVTAGALFLVYGYAVGVLGIEDFGIWAIVSAASSVSAVGNLGMAAGAVRFVAQARALEQPERIPDIMSTSVVSAALALAALIAGAYLILPFALDLVIENPVGLEKALHILPWSLLSFWLASIGAVAVSGIDGFNRVELRATITVLSLLAYVIAVIVLVPRLHLLGLVLAQIVQGVFMCIGSWAILFRLCPGLPAVPYRFRWSVLRTIAGYGISFQFISVAQILFAPTTKALLSLFGGPAAAGLFEMANRMAMQARAVVDAAQRAFLPSLTETHEKRPDLSRPIYERSVRYVVLFVAALVPVLAVLSPVISVIWLGSLDRFFVQFAIILTCGWFLNLLANPSYYANAGAGTLRWNVIGHYVIAGSNTLLGIVLGQQLGPIGVVIGFALALVAGSAVIAFEYQGRLAIRSIELFARDDTVLLISGLVSVIAGGVWGADLLETIGLPRYALLVTGWCTIAVLLPILRHRDFASLKLAVRDALTRHPSP